MIIWRLCVYQLLEAGIERVMDWEMGEGKERLLCT
jgi:hypothetical protein